MAVDESAKNTLISKNDIKRLRRLHQKKYRDAEGLFIVEGEKGVREALSSGAEVRRVYVSGAWSSENASLTQDLESDQIDERSMAAISQQNTPSGLLALVAQMEHDPDVPQLEIGRTLALDGVRDPGNLGTLIRIVDWFGIDRLLLSPDCVDIYNPKVVQSTMGGIFRVKIIIGELTPALHRLSEKGLPILAATMDGKAMGSIGRPDNGVLVLGNESNGISNEVLAACTEKVKIEGGGAAESLNVAVAGGILVHWLVD